MPKTLLSCIFALFLPVVTDAWAADYFVPIDSAPTEGSGIFDNIANGDRVLINLGLGRSYCCTVSTPQDVLGEARVKIGSVQSLVSSTEVPSEANSAIDPAISFDGDRTSRRCLRTDSTEHFVIPTAPFALLLQTAGAPVNDVRIECSETTLTGGFNTFASPFAFLEVYYNSSLDNVAASERAVNLQVTSDSGEVLHSAVHGVPSFGRRDIDIHSVTGPNRYGKLLLTHTGPAGSVVAYLAEYRPDGAGGLILVDRQRLLTAAAAR